MGKLFEKFATLFSFFTCRKIFFQIMTILTIMLVVIAVLGINSFNTIDILKNTTEEVFNKSSSVLDSINTAISSIDRIRINYLQVLSNTSKSGLMDKMAIEDRIFQLEQLKQNDPEQIEEAINGLKEIKNILGRPASPANFEELELILNDIGRNMQSVQNSVRQGSLTLMEESETRANNANMYTAFIIFVGLGISLTIGFALARSISRPLHSMVGASKSLATGKLTENINVRGSAEVNEMAEGMNQAIHGLRNLVSGINEQSNTLAVASRELTEASTDTGQSASQVARAMEELAKATNEQTTQINQAVETINLLSNTVKKVSTDTESIAMSSEKMAKSARVGQKATHDIAHEINQLYDSTKNVAQVIGELNRTSEEISNITSVIEGIAEQTTLLALNASIEAARAGEQGKGFGVVAKETGKLAEQSKQAAKMIETLIVQMAQRTQESVEAIQKGIERAEAGKNLIAETNVTFGNIFEELTSTLTQIEQVAKAARDMSRSNEGVINAITTIASIAEETMASTQEVSATAQQQSASVEQVTALAENLSQIASKLKKSISVFEI